MGHSISNAVPVIRSLPIDTQALGKAPVDSKQAMSTGSVGPRLDAQVLQAGAVMTQSGYTAQQLDDMAGAAFTETENFLVDLAKEEQAKQGLGDTAKSSLTFDPGSWEKHMSVLVSAIVALNVARQSSAAMSGVFTQLAFKAAEAQGVAIKAGGEAAMRAALGGAVVAGVMAVGGAGTQIRGHQMQHTDIKTNKNKAANLHSREQLQRAELKTTPPQKIDPSPTNISISRNQNELDAVQLKNNQGMPFSEENAVLELEIRNTVAKAKDASNASSSKQRAINSTQVVGSTLSSLAHTLSAAVTSTVRLEEYNQRQEETLHGAEQSVNKSVSDAANQASSEASAMQVKQLETLLQIAESRNSTISTIANARA